MTVATAHRNVARSHAVNWADTRDTLHMWIQDVGKIRMALTPLIGPCVTRSDDLEARRNHRLILDRANAITDPPHPPTAQNRLQASRPTSSAGSHASCEGWRRTDHLSNR